jgi:hypothetical protein
MTPDVHCLERRQRLERIFVSRRIAVLGLLEP